MALPTPEIRPEAKPYWDALSKGIFQIQECKSCGNRFHYPRPFCPSCMSRDVAWLQASGNGTIYSFTLVRNKGAVASAPVFVTLDEGPTILSALVDCDYEKLSIGQRVKLKLIPTEGGPPIPFFAPIQ
jgi:uncharacterized OB-fold protein